MRNRYYPKKKRMHCILFYFAESEGFEPPVPLSTTVFKTAAIYHSAISPKLLYQEVLPSESGAKVRNLFEYANFFAFFNSKKKETQSLPFGEQSFKRPCLPL